MEEMKKFLEELAKIETWADSNDFNPLLFSGGNYDDAYYGGATDGETNLARELLKRFFAVPNAELTRR